MTEVAFVLGFICGIFVVGGLCILNHKMRAADRRLA